MPVFLTASRLLGCALTPDHLLGEYQHFLIILVGCAICRRHLPTAHRFKISDLGFFENGYRLFCFWRPGRPLDDPGALGAPARTLWGPGSDFMDLESFLATLNQNKNIFSCLFPVSFFRWFKGLNLGAWGSKNIYPA